MNETNKIIGEIESLFMLFMLYYLYYTNIRNNNCIETSYKTTKLFNFFKEIVNLLQFNNNFYSILISKIIEVKLIYIKSTAKLNTFMQV